MPVLAAYLALAVTPAAAFWLAARGLERFCAGYPRRSSGRRSGRRASGPDLARLAADLRRLDGDYHRIVTSDLPGRARRLQSVTMAYDDTLRACCRALEVPLPVPAPPLPTVVRLQTEAELAQRGLTW